MYNKKYCQKINNAIKYLKQGKIIIYPTDTVWGIGCIADNKKSIKRIFKIKRRNRNKSMIILVNNLVLLKKIVNPSKKELNIIRKIKRPITIIYKSLNKNYHNVISRYLINKKNNSIAIRITKNIICKKIIQSLKKPIISTSANISNCEISPINFNFISNEIRNNVDYVIDIYKNKFFNKSSTIIQVIKNKVITIRK